MTIRHDGQGWLVARNWRSRFLTLYYALFRERDNHFSPGAMLVWIGQIEKGVWPAMPKRDPNIWRYLTPQKFESMLEHKALYFSAADQLDDPYEGSISQLEFDRRQKAHTDAVISASKSSGKSFLPMCVMVSCWFRAERESKAMWDLYAKGSPDALCIKSKLGTLKSECERARRLFYLERAGSEEIDCQNIPKIFVHNIWYYNPHSSRTRDTRDLKDYWLEKYTRKANWFREENEVRALFWYSGRDLYDTVGPSRNECPIAGLNRSPEQLQRSGERQYSQFHSRRQEARSFSGLFLEVDLPNLIAEVVLAPNASHRRQTDIRESIKKWGFDIDVRYSDIDLPPRF